MKEMTKMNKYTKTPPDHTSADGRIRFFHADCMSVMKTAKDGEWDLAVCDPPYGINVTKQGLGQGGGLYRQPKKYKRGSWDSLVPDEEYFKELFRVSKNQIIWGGNYFNLPPTPCFIFWDKNNGSTDFADGELAWTSFNSPVRKFKFTWSGFIQQEMGERKEQRIHITQKPVQLYRYLIQNYAKPGMKILDTHGGSMSSAIAADMEGFEMDIVELDGDYFQAGWNRFSDYYTKKTEIAELGYARTALNLINPTLF